MNLIDTSVFLGHWPFRDVRRTPAELKADLQTVGISHAWVSYVDAGFHCDPVDDNHELLNEVKGDDFFSYVAVLNPDAPEWQRHAERATDLGFHAWKIIPNYHGYWLDCEAAQALTKLAAARAVPVCIQMRLQDERSHHALMKVPGVPAQAIVDLAKKVPDAKIVACAPYLSELKILAQAPNVWMELSFCESGHTLADALKHAPANRLLFGSHAPLHYPAAEAAKLTSSLDIPDDVIARIAHGNASELLGR